MEGSSRPKHEPDLFVPTRTRPVYCHTCHTRFSNGDCQCPGPPVPGQVAPSLTTSRQLLNGSSVPKYAKSKVCNVPDTIPIVIPDTKTENADETKLPLSRLDNECLNYDKEAVNLDSFKVAADSNIFERDFDCVDSVGRERSSHTGREKRSALERTPVKRPKKCSVPSAPVKVLPGHKHFGAPSSPIKVPPNKHFGATSSPAKVPPDKHCGVSSAPVRMSPGHKHFGGPSAPVKVPPDKHSPDPERPGVPCSPVKVGATSSQVRGPPDKHPIKVPPDHKHYGARAPRHACPYCSKTFRSNGKLNSHVFSHTGERPFACKHCLKAFSSKFKLVRHLLIHSEERKFLCTVCERRFLRNDHLKNHYKVHDPRKVVYRCERSGCEKEYSSALSQRKHEAWHQAQDGNLTCLLCDVKHESVAELLVHLRKHSGSRMLKTPADRKFRCNVCERNFLTRKDVTRHLVVHTGERDFLCQFCPQRFGRKDHLIRHIKKSHHGSSKKRVSKKGKRDEEEKVDDDDDDDDDVLDDDDAMSASSELAQMDDSNDSKVPTDLDDIKTSELLLTPTQQNMPTEMLLSSTTDATQQNMQADILMASSSKTSLLTSHQNMASDLLMSSDSTVATKEILTSTILMPSSSETNILVSQQNMASDMLMPSATVATEQIMSSSMLMPSSASETTLSNVDLFGFESGATMPHDDRKGGDLFVGTSQNLLFAEPSFDEEEFKSTDFLLSQQGESSGELLRYLLQSDADAPLPGFSQIFNNSGPPKT